MPIRTSNRFRFIVAVVAGLALLTVVVSLIVTRTTRNWFEKDLRLRSELVVGSLRSILASLWQSAHAGQMASLLADIAHDERIMGAAACGADLLLLARTEGFPSQFSCAEIGRQMGQAGPRAEHWSSWNAVADLPGGKVHMSAIPVAGDAGPLGFVALVHDLSYVERREAQTQRFLLVAFGFLAIAASLLTVVAARLSWRGWNSEMRRILHGGEQKADFPPLLQDVRKLVDQIRTEEETESSEGTWTSKRLKQTLSRYLHGEKVIIVANREPYIHNRAADGSIAVVHPASGLVTALEPVMRACSGVWIAHGNGSADRDVVDANDRVRVPPGEEAYVLRRVWLTADEEKGYYYGFANEGLWPLCHVAHTRPSFRSEDWKYYEEVNRKFAEAVRSEVDSDDPIILVQDYHFALAPRLIRELLPRSTVLTFWHIPWPNAERFGICPWHNKILEGMLGSSILGFHTQQHCNNFIEAIDRFLEARIDRERNAVVFQGHKTLIRPYPISIEWPNRWLETVPPLPECRQSVIADLNLKPDALIGVGVDRLDYTKGVEERLIAVERLLDRFPEFRGRFTFIQLAAPSRTIIEQYRQLNERIEQVAARINDRFMSKEYNPIILLRAHHEPPTVYRYFRAADLCYVSSLHDGMNLVAKEFVCAREDNHGVLILSQFTGAARELTEALIVNPYDIEEASSALAAALRMSVVEQQERMRAMRDLVGEFNVYRWAGRMLRDAARLRHRDRLSLRLSDWWLGVEDAVS